MPTESSLSRLRGRNGVLLGADIAYLVAFILISTRLTVGTFEIVLLVLALLSIVLVGYTAFGTVKPAIQRVINLVQIVIAALLSIRYLLFFFTDLQSIASLLLFGAVIAFGYVAVTGIVAFIHQMGDMSGSESADPSPPPADHH